MVVRIKMPIIIMEPNILCDLIINILCSEELSEVFFTQEPSEENLQTGKILPFIQCSWVGSSFFFSKMDQIDIILTALEPAFP